MIDLPSLVSVSINDMKEYKEDLENMGMLNVNRKLSTKKIGDSRFSGVQEHYGKHERDNTNVIIKLDKDQSKVSFTKLVDAYIYNRILIFKKDDYC